MAKMQRTNDEIRMKCADLSTFRLLAKQDKRPIRLCFSRYVSSRYGMNMCTAYGKFRSGRVKRWEAVGIQGCISQYMPEYVGKPEDFFGSLPSKTDFARFMSSEMGMCSNTVWKRFPVFDFTELEMKGLNEAYREYFASLISAGARV